ncbi:MAG: right-handed parallel beta-helix repeat-containing protein [Candidatus Baldrarchaeia archaeon]
MEKKAILLLSLLIILLLNSNSTNMSINHVQNSLKISGKSAIKLEIASAASNHIQIIGKTIVMNKTFVVNNTDYVEIINSTLDFSNLTTVSTLIENYGTLIINNSHIISNLNQSYAEVISSTGNLTVIKSTFQNKKLLVDFEKRNVTFIKAIYQSTHCINLHNNYFENYTSAVEIWSSNIEKIHNNTFVNCPFGISLFDTNNATIENNMFMNSCAVGISVKGELITIKNNYIYNNRNLLLTQSDLFGNPTQGIVIQGSSYIHVINNTIINTFKCIAIFNSNNTYVESNEIDTTGPKEGEIQAQSSNYLIFRNNIIKNQWDSIEIYNSRHLLIERNNIINGNTAIRVERVDIYGGIDPINVTIQYNMITNSGLLGIEHGLNVKIKHNVLNKTNLLIRKNTANVLVFNNTLYSTEIYIETSKNVTTTNNTVKNLENLKFCVTGSETISINFNVLKNVTFEITDSKNVQITNNTIYTCLGTELFTQRGYNENITIENNTIIYINEQQETSTSEQPESSTIEQPENTTTEETETSTILPKNVPYQFLGILSIAGVITIAIVVLLLRKRK